MNRLDMMDKPHIVIDLETVDILPTAGILSIGAVKFIPQEIFGGSPIESEFYVNVDVENCIKLGMTFSWSTLYWWLKQEKEAGEALQDNQKSIAWALHGLDRFIDDNRVAHIWSNPNKFDVSILENAYRLCGMKHSWDHKEVRDLVTLEALIGIENKEKIKKNTHIELLESGVKHNALYDAHIESYRISEALGILSC